MRRVAFLLALLGCERPAPAPQASCPTVPGGASAASVADIAERVTPSVVSIVSEGAGETVTADDDNDTERSSLFDLHDRGFHHRSVNVGSGVVIASDGLIVTNRHLVANADEIRVVFQDGRKLRARVVGEDPDTDIAVVRVDASDLVPIGVADSGRLRTGDTVLAVGNPYGVGETVTMGIVSAVGRTNVGLTQYDNFIQTDAAMNPGNSGGALVNAQGELVGITTAIITRSGGSQGIGFAIPSRMAMTIADSIVRNGRVVRGWLGASIEDAAIVDSGDSGARVASVTPDGPAARAGLAPGDIVTAIDGQKLTDAAHLRNHVAFAAKGTHVRLDVHRNGDRRSVDVILGTQG